MKRKNLFLEKCIIGLIGIFIISCGYEEVDKRSGSYNNNDAKPVASQDDFSLLNIIIPLPTKEDFNSEYVDDDAILSGYYIILDPLAGKCDPIVIKGIYHEQNISRFIRSDCDWDVQINLGLLDADAKSLNEIYFSNINNNGTGQIIKKDELKKYNGNNYNFKTKIQITKKGKEKGFRAKTKKIKK